MSSDRDSPRDLDHRDEPPVVARLVIEIRSDGTRTIARGAAEDVVRGEKVAIVAEAGTPMLLVLKLAQSITSLPSLLRGAKAATATLRGLLPGRKG